MSNAINVEFGAPYLHECPYEDEPDETFERLAFDTPENVLPYARQNLAIEPGAIGWKLDYCLEELLRNWAIAALDLTLSPKGDLKKSDQEHVDRCLSRLEATIQTDLQMWLENEARYQELIRDRVNEAIQDLLRPAS